MSEQFDTFAFLNLMIVRKTDLTWSHDLYVCACSREIVSDVECLGHFTSFSDDDITAEYCQHETMAIRCRWKSEVIAMTSAHWGRMAANRCLNIHSNFLANYAHAAQDRMFLGCSEDVISIVDKQCSGRSECDFNIPHQLSAITPCYPDLARYLQASYRCIRGITFYYRLMVNLELILNVCSHGA